MPLFYWLNVVCAYFTVKYNAGLMCAAVLLRSVLVVLPGSSLSEFLSLECCVPLYTVQCTVCSAVQRGSLLVLIVGLLRSGLTTIVINEY